MPPSVGVKRLVIVLSLHATLKIVTITNVGQGRWSIWRVIARLSIQRVRYTAL